MPIFDDGLLGLASTGSSECRCLRSSFADRCFLLLSTCDNLCTTRVHGPLASSLE